MKVQQISVSPKKNITSNLADQMFCTCSFCGKTTMYSSLYKQMCEKLSKPKYFFCQFCLRNELYTKSNCHILGLSFKNIIEYYYILGYKKNAMKRKITFSEINDIVERHTKIGLMNPVFKYDEESLLWFVDFRKIGSTNRKIPIQDVHNTIILILSCFNFWEYLPEIRTSKIFLKYKEAIDIFYSKRKRPEGKPFLIPTLSNCGTIAAKEVGFQNTKDFCKNNLEI